MAKRRRLKVPADEDESDPSPVIHRLKRKNESAAKERNTPSSDEEGDGDKEDLGLHPKLARKSPRREVEKKEFWRNFLQAKEKEILQDWGELSDHEGDLLTTRRRSGIIGSGRRKSGTPLQQKVRRWLDDCLTFCDRYLNPERLIPFQQVLQSLPFDNEGPDDLVDLEKLEVESGERQDLKDCDEAHGVIAELSASSKVQAPSFRIQLTLASDESDEGTEDEEVWRHVVILLKSAWALISSFYCLYMYRDLGKLRIKE